MARRCPVAATGKRGGSCLGTVVPGMKARQPGDGWRVGDEICSAYCCKLAAGLGPDLERERERKRCKSYGTCSSTSFSLRGRTMAQGDRPDLEDMLPQCSQCCF